MTRFVRIMSLLAVLGLSLAPLAPVEAQCADHAAMSDMATTPDMPCCPTDGEPVEPMVCKTGCIQVTAVIGLPGISEPVHLPVYRAERTTTHTGWLAPPAIDPPRFTLRT